MICRNCGTDCEENLNFCPSCGTALAQNETPDSAPQTAGSAEPIQPPVYYGYPPVVQPGNGYATASLILGIISFLCFPAITGILGIIFGCVAKSYGNKSGKATAGIICSIVGIILWIAMLVLAFATGVGSMLFNFSI